MRIRTIKPEFWSHRMHEVISETASLIAIGLLSIADDDGRFLANPRAIECVLFPVRAPRRKVATCLAELEQVGYWRSYKAEMDGHQVELGVIPNFRKHQVISRPYPSRLAPPPIADRSMNDPGSIQPDSSQGREEEGKRKEREENHAPAPDGIHGAETKKTRAEHARDLLESFGAKTSRGSEDMIVEWRAATKGLSVKAIQAIFSSAAPGILWPSEFKKQRAAKGDY